MKRNSLLALVLVLFVAIAAWFLRSHRVLAPITPAQVASPALSSTTTPPVIPSAPPAAYTYIEVVNSCGPYYQGDCVNMRSGPSVSAPVVAKLRTGVVLRVIGSTTTDGRTWYELSPGENLRYPERVTSQWWVASDLVELFTDDGDHALSQSAPTTTKRIVVDLGSNTLFAYDGDTLFMQAPISPGIEMSPTPTGVFTVYLMTPSRYMQGPLPGMDDYYDLPGVPWDLYFTKGGAVIHGAYWHDHFGQKWSHGCVNLSLSDAKKLYFWAQLGTKVIVEQ